MRNVFKVDRVSGFLQSHYIGFLLGAWLSLSMFGCALGGIAPMSPGAGEEANTEQPTPLTVSENYLTEAVEGEDWRSYRSEHYGISLSYPPDWTLEPSTAMDQYTLNPIRLYSWSSNSGTVLEYLDNAQIPLDQIKIEISRVEIVGEMTIGEFIDEYFAFTNDGMIELISEEKINYRDYYGFRYRWLLINDIETETIILEIQNAFVVFSLFPSNSTRLIEAERILDSVAFH